MQFICSNDSGCVTENGLEADLEAAAIVQMRRMIFRLGCSCSCGHSEKRLDWGHLELKPTGVALGLGMIRERR